MTAAAAVLVVAPLSGCSLFQSSGQPQPTSLSTPDPSSAAGPQANAPSGSTAASPVVAGAPSPAPVTGYTLTASSPTVVRKFEVVASKFNGVFGGLTVRNVAKGADVTGTVVLLSLRPELVGNAAVERGLLPGMVKGMTGEGAKTTTQKVGGVDVAVAATKTTNIVAWYDKGTVALVLGSGVDPAPTLTFAQAYLAAAH